MENWRDFCNRSLIDKIILFLTGDTRKDSSIIKINSENLMINGELYFLISINAWKNHVTCDHDCVNILEHFIHIYGAKKADVDIVEEAFKQLICESNNWDIKLQRCILQKERVCLFLNRADIIPNAIRMAIEYSGTYGRFSVNGKGFDLKYQYDMQSDLTTQRLHLMRNVAAKILNLHGYRYNVSNEDCIKYMFTTKSEGQIDKGYNKYVCGVVKNLQSNAKETYLTQEQYVKHRIDQLRDFNKYKLSKNEKDSAKNDIFLHNLASAIIIFELMIVKPSRSVIIKNDFGINTNIIDVKGGLFVLYNIARIATIMKKYDEKVFCGDYPNLPNVKDVDFSQLYEEEEWELVYNFIFGYPQMLKDCLRFEPNFQIYPQMICLFLLKLCQKFSVYYRRIRILTEGGNHLLSKMHARLYMLHALKVVLENTLDILDIKPVLQM